MGEALIPSTREEFDKTGWDKADVVLVTGDAYVDHPSFGVAIIARVLHDAGFKVAVIDMPNSRDAESMKLFGRPRLFFGVTGGNVDSTLSRFTSFLKVRNDDPYIPEGSSYERPVRSVISFCNLVREAYQGVKIVIGGLEASMRRFCHYDYPTNKLRRSILIDSRADVLIYGMGEKPIVTLANCLQEGLEPDAIPGTMQIKKELPKRKHILLESEEAAISSKEAYAKFYKTMSTHGEDILVQPTAKRFLVQYPPDKISSDELDSYYRLPFSYAPAPKHKSKKLAAFTMIGRSINSHRGCASGCAFCSIALHQGRRIISRSENSVVDEAKRIASLHGKGVHITDVGGPSANMYGTYCASSKRCHRESCLYPSLCANLKVDTKRWLKLVTKVSKLPEVKKVSIGSGIRYDLFMRDYAEGLTQLLSDFVSGQLKVAPEHTSQLVLRSMRKTPIYPFKKFVAEFRRVITALKKQMYIIPYLMSNHPGSSYAEMKKMRQEISRELGFIPKQVQSFFPLPLTLSSVIYYTGLDPFTGELVFSEKDMSAKRRQHALFFERDSKAHKKSPKRAQGAKGDRKPKRR